MKVWLMKTKKEWFEDMVESNTIRIAETGIEDYFYNYSAAERRDIIKNNSSKNVKAVEGFFTSFIDEMSIGDIVIIGTGQVSKFNISEIARVIGNCKFDSSSEYDLNHYRRVEIHGLNRQFPFPKWGWVNSRIQELNNDKLDEFAELMAQVLF